MASQFRHSFKARHDLLRAFPNLRRSPNLRGNPKWRLKSPASDSYQCVAWAACRVDRKWWPLAHVEFYWPPGLPLVAPTPIGVPLFTPVDYLIQGFATLGYEPCDDRSFEFGYQKVAIYANDEAGATHMARQHLWGHGWLSKPGAELEDIIHLELRGVECDGYGEVVQVLKRSWLTAFLNLCLFRCLSHSLKFFLCRCKWRSLEMKWKMERN
jgi:hypothetical protein